MLARSRTPRPLYRGLTYERYLEVPEIWRRYDIIDGDLHLSPIPTFDHQWLLGEMVFALGRFERTTSCGVSLFAPVDVFIRRIPLVTTRQPDIVYYSKGTLGGLSRDAFKAARRRDVPPDMAVEILSSSAHRRAFSSKLPDYATIRISEVWRVDPNSRVIVVLRLEGECYREAASFADGDYLVSDLLPGFALSISEFFDE